jgi:hypothetical protein
MGHKLIEIKLKDQWEEQVLQAHQKALLIETLLKLKKSGKKQEKKQNKPLLLPPLQRSETGKKKIISTST